MTTHLLNDLPEDIVKTLTTSHLRQTSPTYGTWHTRTDNGDLGLSEVASLEQGREMVIVVENIDLTWMRALHQALNVDSSFFAAHAAKLLGQDPWEAVLYPGSPDPRGKQTQSGAYCWHVDGVFLASSKNYVALKHMNCLPRVWTWSKRYGHNLLTRISFWRRYETIVILVDEAVKMKSATLHLPLSNNRGGLVIPQAYDGESHSLHSCMRSFLSHSWHFRVLDADIEPVSFCYLVAVSSWSTNLRQLDGLIKHIAFEEIREPSVAINNKLHDLRRELDHLLKEVRKTSDYMPASVESELERILGQSFSTVGDLKKVLNEILIEGKALGDFLMDSFTLLLSSISVREAETSAKMSARAQQLTTLAFIYVPLSFVTGIFGMNISEINGSPVPAWVVVATLVVTLTFTALVFSPFYLWLRHKKRV